MRDVTIRSAEVIVVVVKSDFIHTLSSACFNSVSR
jgi:hypothetical protein